MQAILATRRKTLDDLEKKIDEEKKWLHLHNMRELGEKVIAYFGKDFYQSACKDMLEYIFEIEDVKEFIVSEKKKCTAIVSEIVANTNIDDTIINTDDGTNTTSTTPVINITEEHEKETA